MSRKDVYSDGILNMIPPIIHHFFLGEGTQVQAWTGVGFGQVIEVLPNSVILSGLEWIL